MAVISTIKRLILSSSLFKSYINLRIRKDEQRRFTADAVRQLETLGKPELLDAYVRDLKKYMVNFDEWLNMYCFQELTESQKSEFISRSDAQTAYRGIIKPEWRELFNDKNIFLERWKPFIHRSFMRVTPATPEEDILSFITGKTCIVKPVSGSLGQGVYKIESSNSDSDRADAAKIAGTDSLIEECIVGEESIQRFHPQSLNTIRVVTVNGINGFKVLGSVIRFGCGDSVVDNAHAGGIFAHIDIQTGVIDSEAINVAGKRFTHHPDTALSLIGFQIPRWKEITETCIEAHRLCRTIIVGWDVVVNNRGEIEIIEGNHAPDVDLLQAPLKKGIRAEFERAVSDFKKLKR